MVPSKNLYNQHEHDKNFKNLKNYLWKKKDKIL